MTDERKWDQDSSENEKMKQPKTERPKETRPQNQRSHPDGRVGGEPTADIDDV